MVSIKNIINKRMIILLKFVLFAILKKVLITFIIIIENVRRVILKGF